MKMSTIPLRGIAAATSGLAVTIATGTLIWAIYTRHELYREQELNVAAAYVCGMHMGMNTTLMIISQGQALPTLKPPAQSCGKYMDVVRRLDRARVDESLNVTEGPL